MSSLIDLERKDEYRTSWINYCSVMYYISEICMPNQNYFQAEEWFDFFDEIYTLEDEDMNIFLSGRDWIVEKIKSRHGNSNHSNIEFWRQPLVLMIYFMVNKFPNSMIDFPIDKRILSIIYSDLGISTRE